MKGLLAWTWRWSWIAAIPVCTAFLFWATTTFSRWHRFSVVYDSSPQQQKLHEIGVDRWRTMLRRLRLALQGADLTSVPLDAQLRSIQLFAAESDLAKLDDHLPYSGFRFIDGLMTYPDGLHKVKLRYRGDFLIHWGFEKKSFRVRADVDDLFAGMRDCNLIVPKFPEQANNYFAYRLAQQLGLIAPRCELVNLFLNGHNQGVYEFTEQLDEGTLRRHDRMPGDLYAGELISKDAIRGISNQVFDHPMIWEKLAANNHYDLESRAPLERLLTLLAGTPTEAAHAELSRLLDMDVWGRFGAFCLLAQTSHFDRVHNWRLFWDPWRLRFEPVVWDPTGWTDARKPAATVALDLVVSRLDFWLLGNGDYLAARHAALHDFFTSGKEQRFFAEFDDEMRRLQHALPFDPHVRPTDGEALAGALAGFLPFVERTFEALRAAHVENPGSVRWARPDAGTVRLEITGRAPVREVQLRFAQPLQPGGAVVLRLRRLGRDHDVDLSERTTVSGRNLAVPARLFNQGIPEFRVLPDQVMQQHMRRQEPATYDLMLPWLSADNPLEEVLVLRGTEPVAATAVASLPQLDLEFLYRVTPQPRPIEPQVWRGDIVVDDVLDVSDDVRIEPGTTIRLGPKAAILFRGRVTAVGTQQQPIQFMRQHPDQEPWATVAINGAECSGSTFRWCEMRGGSGYKVPLEEYCSMFSVHNCRSVRIEDCWFGENSLFDDLVHVMYASVTFDRVTLQGAMADALDCDISDVVLRNSAFVASGNDGVDLMTSRVLVADCRLERNGDKGISIGEGSMLIALRNRFDGCKIGMEAKDGSIAHIANCDIRNCGKALNAYKKNWRYDGGGRLSLHKSVVTGNGSLPTADRWSYVELSDCQVVGDLAAEYDQEYVDGTSTRMTNTARLVGCDPGPAVRDPVPLPFPGELAPLQQMTDAAWMTVRADTRGVPK